MDKHKIKSNGYLWERKKRDRIKQDTRDTETNGKGLGKMVAALAA